MKANNLLAKIPANLDQEVSEVLVNNKAVCIERIISKGHSSPPTGWYDPSKNEWVMVLKGEAIISFENKTEYIYRLLVHDKVIQPIPEASISQQTMRHKLAIWASKIK